MAWLYPLRMHVQLQNASGVGGVLCPCLTAGRGLGGRGVTLERNGEDTSKSVRPMSDVNPAAGDARRRWLILVVIGLAQLMVILDR
jgi:hypothetical protein